MKATDPPINVTQIFNVSVNGLWNAISVIDLMRHWYFDNIPDFKPEVGFKTKFNIHHDGRDFMHQWEVIEVEPQKKLTCKWTYDGYPGEADVSFEISTAGDKTKLTLTNSILKDFPDDIPEFKRESCIAGWEYFIQKSLKEYLDKV